MPLRHHNTSIYVCDGEGCNNTLNDPDVGYPYYWDSPVNMQVVQSAADECGWVVDNTSRNLYLWCNECAKKVTPLDDEP